MSTVEITAYHLQCDIAGCDVVTEPQSHPDDADEVALEAGWHLDEQEGRDKCPRHAKANPC